MQRHYESLRLREALQRRVDYAKACKELAGLIKSVYASAPKGLQSIMFQDVLEAFRMLPEMDTSQQLSSSNLLLQSLEGVLPKQKRSLATSEYKQAAVAQRRYHKQQLEQNDSVHFPLDILISIFQFLDVHSLAMASLVSRSWNSAAQDDTLWRSHFLLVFENVYIDTLIFRRAGFDICGTCNIRGGNLNNVQTHQQGCWRNAFALALKESEELV
ncbi:hypothetical protein O6H91_02G024100 [Diphasiastrum complanatum]|uniref:Uncharacterized protein n=1 Tax=Diphasiastrum complanatum TaxID=34168 RepID=A0ACC2EDK5_DIPCM|nr:hypothetical protein O6H91_02G024100 [Diphasiastrum complanatum]